MLFPEKTVDRKIFEKVWKDAKIFQYANDESNQNHVNVIEKMDFGENRAVVLLSILDEAGSKQLRAVAFDFDIEDTSPSDRYEEWCYSITHLNENEIPEEWLTRNAGEGEFKGVDE